MKFLLVFILTFLLNSPLNSQAFMVTRSPHQKYRSLEKFAKDQFGDKEHGFVIGYYKMLKSFADVERERGNYVYLVDLYAKKNPKDAIAVIFESLDYGSVRKNMHKIQHIKKKIYMAWESTNVIPPVQHRYLSEFSTHHLSWNDDEQKNKKVYKINHPFQLDKRGPEVDFSAKKSLCLIARNKQPQGRGQNDIYGKRIQYIRFFSKHLGREFGLYGNGWPKISSYKGSCQNKIGTMRTYKFAVCLENSRFPGYITEKIFDCFEAGVIPIYLGAPNIDQYIPSNCYIKAEDYTHNALLKLIKTMDEETYMGYLKNIDAYIASKKAELFSTKQFVDQLVRCVN